MLNWSPAAIRATLGVGGLGIIMLSMRSLSSFDLGPDLEVWPFMVVAMMPAIVFVITTIGVVPIRIARIAQWVAVVWYFVCSTLAIFLAAYIGFHSDYLFSGGLLLVGALPCFVAIRKLKAKTTHAT
jgi:hypothetical protein